MMGVDFFLDAEAESACEEGVETVPSKRVWKSGRRDGMHAAIMTRLISLLMRKGVS